jgi:hypothetical protein
MNQSGIRVANRAGPQAQGALAGKPEPACPQRPAWPFTVRTSGKNTAFAATVNKLSAGFKS